MTPPALEFLSTLYQHFEHGKLTLFSIDGNGERYVDWFDVDALDGIAKKADAIADRNVWFGVATRTDVLPEGRRGGAADCEQIPAMWADIDIAGPNHKDSDGLPATMAEARALLDRFPLRPSIIVSTGGGLHPYWLLDEPTDRDAAVALLARWAETWDQVAAKADMRVDNVFDLPRVLRLPGTVNRKNDAAVEIVELLEVRYSVSEIIDATVEPRRIAPTGRTGGTAVVGTRPGDVYNQRHSAGHVLALDGWKLGETLRNGDERWLHPWSPTSDCSATVYADDGHCTIWSDTVPKHHPTLERRRPYDAFGLYVHMVHDGDFGAATRELAREGYGDRPDITIVTMPNGRCRPKRRVRTTSRHLDDVANEVVAGLVELNEPPRLFVHGDSVSQMERGELSPVDRIALMHIVESSMSPVKVDKEGVEHPSRFDATLLDLALYRLLVGLPQVDGVVHAPFLRPDGTVCADVGYDPSSRMYLGTTLPIDVPAEPTEEHVANAVALIDEMIGDFPLETPSDRAHIFALLATLLTRHLVPLSPLFALDGNGPGVGKNLLAECCMYVATGEWVQTDPLPLDAEEQRKQITAMMSAGRSVALFDEAHIVSGTSLARLITSTTWGDRLLGYSKQVSYPNRITVVALGNNIEVQGDMPRRTILVRLASDLSRPELRSEFRHDDLRGWVAQHRADLLGAVLTIMRAWVVAGRPAGSRKLGSFDQWASMIGGALELAGVDGFLANADEMRARGATDDSDMAAHLAELLAHVGSRGFTVAEVAEMLVSRRLLTWPPKVANDDRKVASQLGYLYRRSFGRWFGDLMITNDGTAHGGVKRWYITERDGGSTDSGQSGGDGGDGGDVTSYTREKRIFTEVAERHHRQGSEPSPPSPPSPPYVESVDAKSPPTDDPLDIF